MRALKERIEDAAETAIRSRVFFEIWWHYSGITTIPLLIDTMNDYDDFFRFDIHAHLTSFVINLSSLYDPTKNTISLKRLLDDVIASQACQTAPEVTRNASLLLSEAAPLAAKLLMLRNKVFGHRCARTNPNDAFRQAQVTPNEIAKLAELSLQIVNELLKAQGLQEYTFQRDHLECLNDLFDALKRDRARREGT